jgi:glycine/D-amino acid oxidase-like deaminating enzyme
MTTTWQEFRKKESYPALEGEEAADVCIIGGGLTGILLAYRLSEEGKRVALLEKREIGSYATSVTTAFITKVIDSPLNEISAIFDSPTAKAVWTSGAKAIDEFERIITKEGIECEFTRCSDFQYASTAEDFAKLKEEYAAYKRYKIEASLHADGSALNFTNAGYLEVPRQAKFHPTKFLYALAEKAARNGALICERSEALSLGQAGERWRIATKKGAVLAQDVVIATYKPITNKATHLKKAMYRSYILEAQVPHSLFQEGIYEDMENPYHFFRIDAAQGRGDYDRLIIGGEDHKDIFGSPPVADLGKKSFKALGAYLAKLMDANEPGGRSKRYWILRKWSGPILEPSDGLPLIGEIAPHRFVATGFSGNGMTYAMIASMLITDQISGRKNEWKQAYDPKRSLLHPKRLGTKAKDYLEEFARGALKNLLS